MAKTKKTDQIKIVQNVEKLLMVIQNTTTSENTGQFLYIIHTLIINPAVPFLSI